MQSVKNILIDIGNSSFCKFAVSDGTSILCVRRVARTGLKRSLEDELGGDRAGVICVSSVAGEDKVLDTWLASACVRYVKVSRSVNIPLELDYSTPETLGADRIAAAAGASVFFPGEDCLIFDFGTAITVDKVSAAGRFSGGNISPGLSMRFNAVHSFTGRLPLVTPSGHETMFGKSTVEAISNGVVLGIMFEVEKYIENNSGCRVIFTGGDSVFFAKKLKYPIFVIPNLVLEGLFRIAQLNIE